MVVALAVLAPAAATAASGVRLHAGDTYFPQLAVGTAHPLVFASLGSIPQGGFASLPTSPFTLKLENDFPISIVYSLATAGGGSVSQVNPDPFEKLGVIGPGRTLTLDVRLSSPASNVQATASVTSAKAIAVNAIGDAVFGSFLPLSPNDLNNLFGAAQGGIASLINQIASQAIQPFILHAISTTTAIARLSKLLIQLGTNRTYRVWLLQHLGKTFNVFSVVTLAARAAKEIGDYAGLAAAHVPGSHTMTVSMQDIPPQPAPSAQGTCSDPPTILDLAVSFAPVYDSTSGFGNYWMANSTMTFDTHTPTGTRATWTETWTDSRGDHGASLNDSGSTGPVFTFSAGGEGYSHDQGTTLSMSVVVTTPCGTASRTLTFTYPASGP